MSTPVLALCLIVLSTGVHQLEGVMTRKYNEKNKQVGFLFTAMVSLFAMLFFLVSDRNGLQFSAQLLPYGLAAGVCYCTASFLTYVALARLVFREKLSARQLTAAKEKIHTELAARGKTQDVSCFASFEELLCADVDAGIRMSLPGIIAHESSLRGGELMMIPEV